MNFTPIPKSLIREQLNQLGYNPHRLAIREQKRLVEILERLSGQSFVRMEFGIPNLPVPAAVTEAEIRALREGQVERIYPPFDGIPELKEEAARFMKNFVNVEVPPEVCMPTCGAMQGGFVMQLLATRMKAGRDTILYLDPGFPVNKLQARVCGLKMESIDFYDFRGEALVREVERRLSRGHIGGVIWSSPNNPTWICLTQEELEGLARAADRNQVLLIEDQAYFGMDLRVDYMKPGEAPYQPSVARCGDYWVMLLSGSKLFSFPGQRVGLAVISPALAQGHFRDLEPWFGSDRFLHAFVHGGIYCSTAGVSHSGQWGLRAALKAANEGELGFMDNVREYAARSAWLKGCFQRHGFNLVYDNDLGRPLADGFYFTVAYEGLDGSELLQELLCYGISMITLEITGSVRLEGLRACVSFTDPSVFDEVEQRLAAFQRDHS